MSILKGGPQTVNYINFDGNDYVRGNALNALSVLNDYEIRITVLLNQDIQQAILSNALGVNDRAYIGYNNSNQSLVVGAYNGTTTAKEIPVNINEKLDVIFKRVSGNITLFVNGVEGTTVSGGFTSNNAVNFTLGARTGGDLFYLNGEIYDLKIYDGSNNLIHNYDFNGSGNLVDSITSTSLTLSGATWQTETVPPAIDNIYYGAPSVQTGLQFDGSNDYVDLGTPTLDIDTEYSLTAKMSTTTNSVGQFIISDDTSPSGDLNDRRIFQFRVDSDGTIRFIRFDSNNNVVANFNTSQSYNNGQEYWVTATFSTSNGSRIYVDGNLIATDSNTTPNNSGVIQELGIGGRVTDVTEMFNGNIYNAQIWQKELSSTEINNYISNLPTGNETGLFAYYDFSEGSGTTLTDSAGTNDGTIVGATWQSDTTYSTIDRVYAGSNLVYGKFPIITDGLIVYLDANTSSGSTWTDLSGNNNNFTLVNSPTYNSGGWFDFNGSSQYATISNLGLSDHTIEGWINFDLATVGSGTDNTPIFGNWGGGSTKYLSIIQNGSVLDFRIDDGVNSFSGVGSDFNFNTNQWYYVALTYNSNGETKSFVNGSLHGTNNYTSNIVFDSLPQNIAYQNENNFYFNGQVAIHRIYNRSLTDNEIQENFDIEKSRFGL